MAGGQVPVERDESVTELCRQAVERLALRLPGAQVYCHLRVGDAIRVIASEGGLRLIYEVRREQGGICWRAAETGEAQLVEDVRRPSPFGPSPTLSVGDVDPDHLDNDECLRRNVHTFRAERTRPTGAQREGLDMVHLGQTL